MVCNLQEELMDSHDMSCHVVWYTATGQLLLVANPLPVQRCQVRTPCGQLFQGMVFEKSVSKILLSYCLMLYPTSWLGKPKFLQAHLCNLKAFLSFEK